MNNRKQKGVDAFLRKGREYFEKKWGKSKKMDYRKQCHGG